MMFLEAFLCLFSLNCLTSLGTEKTCFANKDDNFSYDKELPNGPPSWGNFYPTCNGNMQSPVDIETENVVEDRSLKPLKLKNYNKPIKSALMNNDGHTVNVIPQDGVVRSFEIKRTTYILQSLHWHWDSSEHTVNNEPYTMEFHLVHTNSKGEIAVIAVFLQSAFFDNGAMNPIVQALPQVKYANTSTQLEANIKLDKLIDDECAYYRYTGSLTTPPCSEGVIWTICKDPKNIEYSKVRKFKQVYSTKTSKRGCKITQNYRPIQPLNGREISTPTFHIF